MKQIIKQMKLRFSKRKMNLSKHLYIDSKENIEIKDKQVSRKKFIIVIQNSVSK